MDTSDWFQNLLSQIQPLQSELNAAKGHASTIASRLGKNFKLSKLITIGSHSRGSAIRKHSDVDCFAVISRDDARWGGGYKSSSTMLSNIKEDLLGRYSATQIGIDGQATVVHFNNGDFPVDVVPAIFLEMNQQKRPTYYMPDGNGDWMLSSPDVHNGYIAQADAQSGGKLKYVAQLFKFWRECRNPRISISSFHVELMLAESGICTPFKSYSQCLMELFQYLAYRECRAIRDPMGLSGNVNAVKTEAQRLRALATVVSSRDHAKSAFAAEGRGDQTEAIRQWKIVFNY